jgi:hypothetical protein
MASYQLPDGRKISDSMAFTLNDVQYPSNWLLLSTEQELMQRGITGPLPEPLWYDQRWAWGFNDDGSLNWKDLEPLKEEYIAHVKRNAGSMLGATDWMVTRSAEPNGKQVPDAVLAERAAIRAKSDEKEAAIEATITTEELAAYITSSAYSNWGEEPTPEGEDTLDFNGGISSGVVI